MKSHSFWLLDTGLGSATMKYPLRKNKRPVALAQPFKIYFGECAESLDRGEQARQSFLREVAFLLQVTPKERGFLHKRRIRDPQSYVEKECVQSHLREIQSEPGEQHNTGHH